MKRSTLICTQAAALLFAAPPPAVMLYLWILLKNPSNGMEPVYGLLMFLMFALVGAAAVAYAVMLVCLTGYRRKTGGGDNPALTLAAILFPPLIVAGALVLFFTA